MEENEACGSPWLTRQEAATRARVSPATIDRWARNGAIPRYLSPGGEARYRVQDIDALMRKEEG